MFTPLCIRIYLFRYCKWGVFASMRQSLAISMSVQSDPFLGMSNDNSNNNKTAIVHMMFARAQRFYFGFHLNIWAQQFQPKLPSDHIKSENRMEKRAFCYAIPVICALQTAVFFSLACHSCQQRVPSAQDILIWCVFEHYLFMRFMALFFAGICIYIKCKRPKDI